MNKKNILNKLISKFKFFVNNHLNNINNHFSCFLPSKTGIISSFFLRRIFSGIRMENEQVRIVKSIPEEAITVFITKYKSNFEFLFAHTRHKQLKIPIPQLAFDYSIHFWQPITRIIKIYLFQIKYILKNKKTPNPYNSNYYKNELLRSRCALISLVEKKEFYLRFIKKKKDPLHFLIKTQKEITQPIYLVPQLMFFDRRPLNAEPTITDILFGNIQNPKIFRKIAIIVQSPGKAFVEVSQPINLLNWLKQNNYQNKHSKHLALILRQQLLLQHNRHRHMITGPVLKSSEEMKEIILTNTKIRKLINKYSDLNQEPVEKIRKKANSYINEISAKYNPIAITIMSSVVDWITNSMFDGTVIDKKGLNKVKQISKQGPVILIPCHKSHIDYLILSYVLYNNNMPCPHIAAGKNLSFWPVGAIFKSGGAFFIRRSFKGKIFYTKILSEYIYRLLKEGFNIELFIEGGRSRTGKLLTPKLGLISILLKSFKKGACKNMFFVPVYIGYDRIIEEHAYIHELEGGNKQPENFLQVLKARRFLKRRYGKIYINFHDPISITDILSNKQNQIQSNNFITTNRGICRDIGRYIMNSIDKKTVITPHGLTAAAILNISQNRFTSKNIMTIINSYLSFSLTQNAKISDTLVLSPAKALKNAFDNYKHRKLIEEVPHNCKLTLQDIQYTIKSNKRTLLEFYKNNCIAYFIHGAIVALLILEKDAFQFCASALHEQHWILTYFFKYEFAFDPEKPSEFFVRKTIKAFINDSMLMPHKTIPDTYNITSSGYQKLKLYAIFLKPYLESYLVVLEFFKNQNKQLHQKDQVKKVQSIGLQMHKRGDIDLIESVSKVNYINGIKLFSEFEIHNRKKYSHINIVHYQNTIYKYIRLINK